MNNFSLISSHTKQDLQEQIPSVHSKFTSTAQHTKIYHFQLPSVIEHQGNFNDSTTEVTTLTQPAYSRDNQYMMKLLTA